jgi:threonine dehydrogenase-like Zn-dependent dehydrogenase
MLIAGHEPAGIVEAVGSEVTDFAVGDRVLVYHILGCGNCLACRKGHPVVCESKKRAAYGGERNGAHAPLLGSLMSVPKPARHRPSGPRPSEGRFPEPIPRGLLWGTEIPGRGR